MAVDNSGTGTLRVRTFTAEQAVFVPNVTITIYPFESTVAIFTGTTDDTGILEGISLPCPPKTLSLDETNTERPYGLYTLVAEKERWQTHTIEDLQIFDTIEGLAELLMLPEVAPVAEIVTELEVPADVAEVPEHVLLAGGGGSGPGPETLCDQGVLPTVIIPTNITVHLGKPTASATNVTVPFRDYIKRVCCSEIYATWPEQAIRANVYAQIGLAINRVWTEWYKSKGYNFQITNSTSYDQYYVHGCTIYDNVSKIVDEIFNTYLRKVGEVNPFYSEYCDGKQVSCPGMKQWGTVDLANQGMSAIQILRYYYGSTLEIVTTNNIQSIPESYPGTPLQQGANSEAVSVIQRQLNRIAQNYPAIGTVTVDGNFGPTTTAAVKAFQKIFSLTQDGIVGPSTWYKISYIYVAVKKLAELGSEGEKATGVPVEGGYPGTPLQSGSTGEYVMQIQFWLNELALYTTGLLTLTPDGIYGANTTAAVRAFQTKYGLTVDGVVGPMTWAAIYDQYYSLESDLSPIASVLPGQFQGTTLSAGATGNAVKQMQFYLRIIAQSNTAIPVITADGVFGANTTAAVRAFQTFYGLAVDGAVGRLTWNRIYEVYTDIAANIIDPTARPGVYPGSVLQLGSTGQYVTEMQYYLYILSAYYSTIPQIAYDGTFGTATQTAVRAFQALMGLTVDGIVGPATWNALYLQFSKFLNIDGNVAAFNTQTYPGYSLQLGSTDDAVLTFTQMLDYIGDFYEEILPTVNTTDNSVGASLFSNDVQASVLSFQRWFGLPLTGIVDQLTWNAMETVYLSTLSGSGEPVVTEDGEYPGYVLTLGSAGNAVEELQFYLNGIAARFCQSDFVPEIGVYDLITQEAVERIQAFLNLKVTGDVDRITWDAIYDLYSASL